MKEIAERAARIWHSAMMEHVDSGGFEVRGWDELPEDERERAIQFMEKALMGVFGESAGALRIAQERLEHESREGYTTDGDYYDHAHGQLAAAAMSYAMPEQLKTHPFIIGHQRMPIFWPWHQTFWKPTPNDRVRELVKAGSLIAAEIDRLLAKP